MQSKNRDVIDHIDPRNSDLICGLDIKINKIITDCTTNHKKNNRFVPYMVDPDIAIHQEFGDWGIFLIQDKWCWCEFGGAEWWAESKRLVFSSSKGAKKLLELKVGIHARSAEQMTTDGLKGVLKQREERTGFYDPDRKVQSAGGLKSLAIQKASGTGFYDPKLHSANGKKVCSQKWQCLKTKVIANPGNLSRYQNAHGIDTSLRIRRLDLEG